MNESLSAPWCVQYINNQMSTSSPSPYKITALCSLRLLGVYWPLSPTPKWEKGHMWCVNSRTDVAVRKV